MYNKPNIIDAREKVRYTILTCQNRNQLVRARQFARNFRTLYGLSLSIYILFPELLKQSRNLYLGRNNSTLQFTKDVQFIEWVELGKDKPFKIVPYEEDKMEILTFTTPHFTAIQSVNPYDQEVESIHSVFNTLLNK